MQILFERRQPGLRALEPAERLIDGGEARLGDARRLRVELAHRLFVRLLQRLHSCCRLRSNWWMRVVDSFSSRPLDVVPFAQTPVELDDGGGVLLVVLRPAIEDAGAIARHVGETRLEAVHRFLGVAKLLEGDVDLLELHFQIGFALVNRSFAIRGASLFHSPPMIRQTRASQPKSVRAWMRDDDPRRSKALQSSCVNRTMLS